MSTALTIPDIDPKTEDALRRRAEAANTSMADAAKAILAEALSKDREAYYAHELPEDVLAALDRQIAKLPKVDPEEYPEIKF